MTSSGTSRPASPEVADPGTATVAVLADDLIWGTRLAESVRAGGGRVVPVRSLDALRRAVPAFAIVDLTARAYDGIEAVRVARELGARVLAVGQHDDVEARRAALQAGASRVVPYRRLHEDGPSVIRRWLAEP